ncbi:hypothetical protein AJ79_10029 [Helicocarpus griseus UAMH5409]|uniref:PH domain-containing protein n=1 Tax=Helicocarpus griseus UAMH5409 TaxID=1447875 RepID=A0A2B7WFX8_9EURO|nr:hypothetical protein AJ79_10029 [Helicocarpus griseus UAMH5409]
MSTSGDPSERPQVQPGPGTDGGYFGLDPESHTAQRLYMLTPALLRQRHASPEHLHITNRRAFIGPIPKSWFRSHRKTWYKRWLGLKDYSSRPATFSVDTPSSPTNQRQLVGFLEASNEVDYRQSFPQPEDVDEDEEPVEATPVAPIDTSQEAPPPEDQRQNHPLPIQIQGEHGGPKKTDSPFGHPGVIKRLSSSNQEDVEQYFTPSESLRERRSGLFQASDLRSGQSGTPNTDRVNGLTPVRVDKPPSSPSVYEEPSGAERTSSDVSLIPHRRPTPSKLVSRESSRRLQAEASRARSPAEGDMGQPATNERLLSHVASKMVRFQHDENAVVPEQRPERQRSRVPNNIRPRHRRMSVHEGEIIRAERMLVRIDATRRQTLPEDFSENDSVKVETRISEKWREYLVVCRQGTDEDTPFTLQLYKTRVIPQVQISQVKRTSSHEIPLTLRFTKVNLFSSLDKTVVLWHPNDEGSLIYIMRTKSAAHSVEWYTFLRTALGWQRPKKLMVHVPDLNVSLLLKHPFSHLQNDRTLTNGDNCSGLLRTMTEERAVAAAVIKTSMSTLSGCAEWARILDVWPGSEKMGLAWRRYDRLEWVHGANEERMYGTIAMRTSHELELRPKRHYPTNIRRPGEEAMEEPPPVEGFLILLTSQKGKHQRLGKAYSRKLYFSSQNQYLCFCKPGKAAPPPPPRLPTVTGSNVPTAAQLSKQTPIIYSIDPYPLKNGEISWLLKGNERSREQHDAEAYGENRRNLENLERAEGYFNLCRVLEVRIARQNQFSEEPRVNGGNVDFHDEREDSGRDWLENRLSQSEVNRSFELVMNDGMVVKFRAYNKQTRDEWVRQLSDLVQYWSGRTREDVSIMKSVRQQNLEQMNITEEQEAMFGQFAQKWEVSKAQASSELFNICGVSGCRAVKMSGNLYCKPRRRSAFTSCSVILTEGQILVFQSLLRKLSGEEIPHTHHAREWALDLRDCYVYSGFITDSDLLYQSHTIDSNLPSQDVSPRLYVSDGWTSSDEDITTCFVVWHNTRKTVFRSEEERGEAGLRTKWKKVSALGVPGRSIVFKTRSRTERDMWVLAIETEIDRLQQQEDVRIIKKGH